MACPKEHSNGRLEEAQATLVQTQSTFSQTQATFAQTLAPFLAQMAVLNRQSDERLARIEAILMQHSRILAELTRAIDALPEAIRDKIGFKVPVPSCFMCCHAERGIRSVVAATTS